MTWTTNKPTQPGWYWIKIPGMAPSVEYIRQNTYGDLCLGIFNLKYHGRQWKWTGPLPEPDEPTERDERESQP